MYNMQSVCIAYVNDVQAALNKVKEADASQRALGTVAYSPGHGIGNHRNFKDWALVQMADTGRGEPSAHGEYTNKVYMAERVTEAMIRAEASADPERWQLSSHELDLGANGFLQLHGRDIPSQPPFAGDDRTSHLVAKRGQTTGFRFGITNEIEAVRRIPFGKKYPLVSLYLLVLDFVGGHFSQPGDSGSCVFDCTCRAMGILDGGERVKDVVRYMKKYHLDTGAGLPNVSAVPSQEILPEGLGLKEPIEPLKEAKPGEGPEKPGEDPSPDVTFVTPIQWILEDIREFTGCEPEIL